jgi:small subunit ribosomal protein S1
VKDVLKVGQEVEARVIKIDKDERRIGLSIKAAGYDADRLAAEITSYDRIKQPPSGPAPTAGSSTSSGSFSSGGDFNSLGDLLDKAGN